MVELHREGSAPAPTQQACFFLKLISMRGGGGGEGG